MATRTWELASCKFSDLQNNCRLCTIERMYFSARVEHIKVELAARSCCGLQVHLATKKANEVVDFLPEQRNFFVPLNSAWHKRSHGRDGRGVDETTEERKANILGPGLCLSCCVQSPERTCVFPRLACDHESCGPNCYPLTVLSQMSECYILTIVNLLSLQEAFPSTFASSPSLSACNSNSTFASILWTADTWSPIFHHLMVFQKFQHVAPGLV